ncbi:hypothetical protein [Bradyrhizobium sp. Tv2a-2]|uniref:hypothetical protein n=1 Tax=Bradyrhizobium sp. Tv2a-2 TaxID=113395 RepID=UPI000407177E|nr:hypothetical protein [Bradyrhizobium sp. Tv2a-2]
MTASAPAPRISAFAVTASALLALGLALSGCAGVSSGGVGEDMMAAFGDPAKYDLYDCRQLETERKTLASREAELQGLMAKAQTGTAGPVVAEMAYRNDYLTTRGQAHFADEAWRKNKCHPSPPGAATASVPGAPAKPAPPQAAR